MNCHACDRNTPNPFLTLPTCVVERHRVSGYDCRFRLDCLGISSCILPGRKQEHTMTKGDVQHKKRSSSCICG